MEGVFDAIGNNGVASVGTTVKAGAHIEPGSEDVDKLALALVAPLGAKDDGEAGATATSAPAALFDQRTLETHLFELRFTKVSICAHLISMHQKGQWGFGVLGFWGFGRG